MRRSDWRTQRVEEMRVGHRVAGKHPWRGVTQIIGHGGIIDVVDRLQLAVIAKRDVVRGCRGPSTALASHGMKIPLMPLDDIDKSCARPQGIPTE